MKNCISCGRVLQDGAAKGNGYCRRCCNQDGTRHDFETVLKNLTNDFVETQGIELKAATDAAREVLKRQPAWEPLFKKEIGKQRMKRGLQIGMIVLITVAITAGAAFGFYLHFRITPLLDDMFGIVKTTERINGNQKIYDIDTNNFLINPVLSEGKAELIFEDKTFKNVIILNLNNKKAVSFGSRNYILSQIKSNQDKYVFSQKFLPYPNFRHYDGKSSKIIMIINDDPLYAAWFLTDIPEEIARELNPIINDKYVVWTDGSKYIEDRYDIRGFSFATKKEIDIAVRKYDQVDPFFCGNKLFWYDYGNPEKPGFEIQGINFDNNEKIKIPIEAGETIIHTKNGRHICWIGKDLKNAFIYDTIKSQKKQFWDGFFNQYHEYEPYSISTAYLDEFSHQEWAGIFVSDAKNDNPVIAWEAISKNINGKFINIAYKKLNDPLETINYVIPTDLININLNLDGIMLQNLVYHTTDTYKYNNNYFTCDQEASKGIMYGTAKDRLYIYDIVNNQSKLLDEQFEIMQVSTNNKYIAWSYSKENKSNNSISYLQLNR